MVTNRTYIITYMYHAQTPRQVHWVPTLARAWRCSDFTLKVCIGPLLGQYGGERQVDTGAVQTRYTQVQACVHTHMWVYTQHAWGEEIVKLSRGKAEFR